MEAKRQRKRLDYARLSRSGLEAASTDDPQAFLPCSSCDRKLHAVHIFLSHINHCTKESHVCPVCCEERLQARDEDKEDVSGKTAVSFSCGVELDKHVSESHPDSSPFLCWACRLRFPALSTLQKHQVVDHKVIPNALYEVRSEEISCSGCQSMFETTDQLAKHFKSRAECGGNLMLWQCVDPEQDAENDILIRLRECLRIESEFLSRFPRSRIGLDFIIGSDSIKPPRADVKVTPKPKSSEAKTVSASATPKDKKQKKVRPPMKVSGFTAKVALKSQPAKNRPSLTKATGPPKVKFVAKKAGKAAKKQEKTSSKKRPRPSMVMPQDTLEINSSTTVNVSPKRRRVSESPVRVATMPMVHEDSETALAAAEEELDDAMSSPEAPFAGQGGSPGLEPEGDEEEEETTEPVQPLVQITALSMSCDLDEEEEDSRAAPAVEMNVCRACGLALDSFSEYTAHMQEVHDLNLQSPPVSRGRGRPAGRPSTRPVGRPPGRPGARPVGRPPKNAVNKVLAGSENDESLAALKNAEFDQVLHQVHWSDSGLMSGLKPGKKRGRKPKHLKEDGGLQPLIPSWSTALASAPLALLCPVCPDRPSFSSSEAREAHLAAEHDGERAFGCQACGETFSLFYELQLHTRQEHDVGNGPPPMIEDPARAKLAYKCVVCKVGFKDEAVLQRHYDAMHTLDEGEQYHCPVCYFTYSGCRTRDDHVIKKHPDARAFKCPVCEARFASFEVFRAHEKRAHISQKTRMRSGMGTGTDNSHSLLGLPDKPKKTPRRKLAAAMRGALAEKSNDTVEALAEKRRKSHVYKEGTLYCEKCNEDCANEEELDIHTKEHVRKEKRFGCTQCGRVFSGALARSFLVDHIKLEHMHQSAYVCDDCGQRFLYKVQSDRHRSVDRDSGVASCKRAEELNIALPRLVFGCSRCAKIFAGEGAQSRYSEHQLECVGAPPTPAVQRPRDSASHGSRKEPAKLARPTKEAHEVALAITEAVGVIDAPVDTPASEPGGVDVDAEPQGPFSGAEDSADSGLMDGEEQQQAAEEAAEVVEEPQQRTVIVLPSNEVAPQTEDGDQVVVLPEDVLSNVRAAGLGDDVAPGGSVVLIQADDGTLIVASEEHLAELQMQEGQESVMVEQGNTRHLLHDDVKDEEEEEEESALTG